VRTLGLRIKSGFTIAIVASGDARSWTILSRHHVALSDSAEPYSRFPFHPGLELEGRVAEETAKRALTTVKTTSKREIAALLKAEEPLDGAVLVVGSLIDPAKIANPHMRAHASEGALFRDVVCTELDAHGLRHQNMLERDAYAFVAQRMKCDETQLRADVDQHGKKIVKPWRAEEKLAALAAYWQLALAR
jgi:hypothetical protein